MVLAAVFAVVVLALALRPLWRDSRSLALGIAGTAVVSTLALYHLVGTPAALDRQALAAPNTLADAVTQLEAELTDLAATDAVLTGRRRTPFERALLRVAAGALEEQLGAVRQAVTLAFTPGLVLHDDLTVTVHHDELLAPADHVRVF